MVQGMNRALIQDPSAQAERHVAEGEQRIEETQALQETDLARIRTELQEANPESR
jgi:hypothetical protein